MTNDQQKIVVRIPPSPTGFFHVGRARTALFNFLFARKSKGEIVFRLEDTDKERSKKEYEQDIFDALEWLGITYDHGPFRQSERTEVYRKHIQLMLDNGTAYISHESEGENKEVIRFKNPNKVITFNDTLRGEISVDTTDLKDFVVARNIDDPLYHLTVVVDDHEMGVTHVVRGDDGIANTPRQILLQEAIGAIRPTYTHLPLILGSDRSKMSARHGATSLRDFKAAGYLPEAMVNYLALLGWNPGTDQEIFSMEELIEQFDITKIQKGGAVFDEKKLRWVNKEHIKRLDKEVLEQTISDKIKASFPDKEIPAGLTDIIAERIEVFSDIDNLIGAGELDYYFAEPELDVNKIGWKETPREETISHLEKVENLLKGSTSEVVRGTTSADSQIMEYADQVGKGNVLWPLRYSLSGRDKSPDPLTLVRVLGKEESLKRIAKAIELLK
jgi:glutamyl-tRNA synthetase